MGESIELSPLFPFDLIFDTDFGLIKLTSKEYRADLFDKSVLDADDATIKELLVTRQYVNPLCILTEYMADKAKLDEYYLEFKKDEYEKIINLSEFTNVGKYCMGFDGMDEINPYIYCKSKIEEDFIASKCHKYKYKIVTPGTIGNLEGYDPIFVKDGFDYIDVGPLVGHSLFVVRYGFNVYYDGEIEYIDYAKACSVFQDCKINTIDLYGGKNERRRNENN